MKIVMKKNEKRFIKFSLVGITGIFVNMIVLYMFTKFGIYYMLSAVFAYESSIISNFLMNDKWTFKESIIPGKSHSFFVRMIYFNCTRISGAILGIIILYLLTEFLKINYMSSNIISIMIGTIWTYFSSVKIVWNV